jgi:hypothetical protein
MKRSVALLALVMFLAGCTSATHSPTSSPQPSATPAATSSAAGSSPAAPSAVVPSNSNVVDGITIPPVYVTTRPPVVPTPKTCPTAFAHLLSAFDKRGQVSLSTERSDGEITCDYSDLRAVSGGCTKLRVIVNTEPDAYQAFYRWTVEVGQNSMWSSNPANAPQPISGIGVLAEWVPGVLTFETGSASTWVSIFLTCPVKAAGDLTLSKALARAGLASTAG